MAKNRDPWLTSTSDIRIKIQIKTLLKKHLKNCTYELVRLSQMRTSVEVKWALSKYFL